MTNMRRFCGYVSVDVDFVRVPVRGRSSRTGWDDLVCAE